MIGRDDAIRTLSERLMMSRFVSIVGPALFWPKHPLRPGL
jgi:hypothetical protein